jgi:hypothetical protein
MWHHVPAVQGPLAVSWQETCDRCKDGRLLGEAVHDRDGGWQYFLSCFGCGARTPLDADAHRRLMQEQPRVAAGGVTPPVDRDGGAPAHEPSGAHRAASSFADHKSTCAHPGCTTRLSIYNSSPTCWAHS